MDLIYFFNLFPMKKTYTLASISILFLRDILCAWRKLYKKTQYYALDRRSFGIIHICTEHGTIMV